MTKINKTEQAFLDYIIGLIGDNDYINFTGSARSKYKVGVSKFFRTGIAYTPDFEAKIDGINYWFETKGGKSGYMAKTKTGHRFVPIDNQRFKLRMKLVKDYCKEKDINFKIIIFRKKIWYDITDMGYEKEPEKNKVFKI